MVLALKLRISSPMPKRAASSPRRSRDEPLLLAGKRASIMLSTTAVDHTWASHDSRSSPRSRCSGIRRIYERECARMSSTRRPWACARDRRRLESRAWGWAPARDWRRRIQRLWRSSCTWREPKAHQAATKQIRARFIQDEARAQGWSWTRGHDAGA
jgi:hypothetical protein